MKVLCNIFETVSASDEFKSTCKLCLKWALPDHTRKDPKSAERPWRHESLACLSLFLFGLLSVLCFVLISARFLTASNRSRDLNVLVKIRLEFVFNRYEKWISAFDCSLTLLGATKELPIAFALPVFFFFYFFFFGRHTAPMAAPNFSLGFWLKCTKRCVLKF